MSDSMDHRELQELKEFIRKSNLSSPHSNYEWVKWAGIALAVATTFGSATYQYGTLQAEHRANNESRAEMKVIGKVVTRLESDVGYIKEMLKEVRNRQ